jgi:hypothetical protein
VPEKLRVGIKGNQAAVRAHGRAEYATYPASTSANVFPGDERKRLALGGGEISKRCATGHRSSRNVDRGVPDARQPVARQIGKQVRYQLAAASTARRSPRYRSDRV